MLIRFNVKNFLSFSSRIDSDGQEKSQEFSMLTGRIRSKQDHILDEGYIKLLKFAAVYGANASGKSNLVKAMWFMRNTILYGLPRGHRNLYCKSSESNKEKPSYFEMEILLKDKIYSYGFEVILSESRFVSEWLVKISSNGKEEELYVRDISSGTHDISNLLKIIKSKELEERLEIYASDIDSESETLLLSFMNHGKNSLYGKFEEAALFRDLYLWFLSELDINYPDRPISNYTYMANSKNVEEICRIISAFGTGITGYKIVDIDRDAVYTKFSDKRREDFLKYLEDQVENARKITGKQEVNLILRNKKNFFMYYRDANEDERWKTINFTHSNNSDVLFGLSEESDGTVRVLDLLEILLSDGNKTFVVDELDRCLHPCLTYRFVQTFLREIKKKNIQLIVTTHESRLLDFDLLRRDEIWFTNKKPNGETDIYSLEEYNARFDQKIDKAYLEGRYGGVPIFTTVFPVEED